MNTEALYARIKALILSGKIQFPGYFLEIIPAKTISEDCGFDWVIFKHKLDNPHLFTLNEMMTIANTSKYPSDICYNSSEWRGAMRVIYNCYLPLIINIFTLASSWINPDLITLTLYAMTLPLYETH